MSDWRPISTAPLDGTRVLLHRRGWAENMAVGWWSGDGWNCVYGSPFLDATSWMPLPAPALREEDFDYGL